MCVVAMFMVCVAYRRFKYVQNMYKNSEIIKWNTNNYTQQVFYTTLHTMMQASVETSPTSISIATYEPIRETCFAKLILVGNSGVGKTSLLRAFADGDYCASYLSTLGMDFRIVTVSVGDIDVKTHLWDSCGNLTMPTCHIVLTCDVARPRAL